MGRQFVLLFLTQLVLANCHQYGSTIQRDFVPPSNSYSQQVSLDVPTFDPCEPNPCQNMGTCVSSKDMTGFWCYCLDNTYGDYCENIKMPTTTTQAPREKLMQKLMPLRQSSYGQQPPFLDLPTTTTTTTTTQPPFQPIPSYGAAKGPLRLDPVIPTTACSQKPCMNNGICSDLPNGQWFCTCPWGYTGAYCEECLTDCKSNPCPSNKLCKAFYRGGYECVCPSGFSGVNCDLQNDICSTNPCLNGGMCKALESGEYTCQCREGFSGLNCETTWTNPCTEEVLRSPYMIQFEAPWNRTAYIICLDIDTWVQMPCSTSTVFNRRLGHCVSETYVEPACPAGFCLNDGECGLDKFGELACKCKEGYMGDNCEINVDECQLNGNACAGGMCFDQINTYYCVCPSGVGLDCVNTIANPCTSDLLDSEDSYFEIPSRNRDHFLHCTSLGLWTVRKCAAGLFWNQEEKTCTMELPTLKSGACLTYPCKNGAQCEDAGNNQYRCLCKEGYTGPRCETVIDYCETNPCQNGGRCLSYIGGYTCVCQDKVIDECCCNGVINPCADKSSVYYPHVLPNRYIHCDSEGRAFVRTCSQSTVWVQSLLSCMTEEMLLATETTKIFRDELPPVQSSYGQQPQVEQPKVTVTEIFRDEHQQSYGQQTIPQVTVTEIFRDEQPREQAYGQRQKIMREEPIVRPVQPQPAYGQRQEIMREPLPKARTQAIPQRIPVAGTQPDQPLLFGQTQTNVPVPQQVPVKQVESQQFSIKQQQRFEQPQTLERPQTFEMPGKFEQTRLPTTLQESSVQVTPVDRQRVEVPSFDRQRIEIPKLERPIDLTPQIRPVESMRPTMKKPEPMKPMLTMEEIQALMQQTPQRMEPITTPQRMEPMQTPINTVQSPESIQRLVSRNRGRFVQAVQARN